MSTAGRQGTGAVALGVATNAVVAMWQEHESGVHSCEHFRMARQQGIQESVRANAGTGDRLLNARARSHDVSRVSPVQTRFGQRSCVETGSDFSVGHVHGRQLCVGSAPLLRLLFLWVYNTGRSIVTMHAWSLPWRSFSVPSSVPTMQLQARIAPHLVPGFLGRKAHKC